MPSYGNFQNDNNKYSRKDTRVNQFNPDFTPSVDVVGNQEGAAFHKNIDKWATLVAYMRWFPDRYFDLIKPKTGGMILDLDQRVFMRCMVRFYSVYGCYPRGWGKTLIEVMTMFVVAIFYPNMEFVMTAQTRENAAALLNDKYNEIVKFFPLIKDEIYSTKFQKDIAEIIFHNGSRVDVLANNQSSKGRRRKRIMVEESALLDNKTYEDVLEPIPNVPRRTVGKMGLIDKAEMNGQNHFLTTTGFRGSDEYYRCLKMVEKMADLEGYCVLGAGWELGCFYGRGESKARILEKKSKLAPISFARNYCEKWVGCDTNSLVNANKLLNCRNLAKSMIRAGENDEFILGVDVARSQNSQNNQSSITPLQIRRKPNGRIKSLEIPNIITISGVSTFTSQAISVKRAKYAYGAKAIIIDSNGLGKGLLDELLKSQIDPVTGETLPCFATINTDDIPEDLTDCDRCIYDLKPQSANSEIIVSFIDVVESGLLRLLNKRDGSYDLDDNKAYKEEILPFIQTDFLVDEVLNLRLKHLANAKLTVEKVVGKVDKDRFSSSAYAIWYAKTQLDGVSSNDDGDDGDYLRQLAFWF